MSGLFSKPKIPKVASVSAPEPPPERSAAETTALSDEQRARFANRGGRAMTMLTGGLGTEGGSSAVRFLGGAART